MRLGVTIAGLAARLAAARVERMRMEAVRAALDELAWRRSGKSALMPGEVLRSANTQPIDEQQRS